MEKKNYFLRMMQITKLCFIAVAVFAFSSVAGQAPTNGLALYYDFETISGTVVPDASGNSLDGAIIGNASIATGYTGIGINFPTVSNPAVDYVQLPNGITGTLTDFTIAAWVKMDKVDWWMRIFDFGGGTNNYMFLTARGGNLKFAFKNGGAEQIIDSDAPLSVGSWTHVAVSCSYNTTTGVGSGTLYRDGIIVGTNNSITITPAMLDATLGSPTPQNYIGKSQWPDNGLNATVDEFRIYNRALSYPEVLHTIGVYPAELITQWENLDLGDLSAVETDITLPATAGSNGVTVTWTSSNTTVITNTGVVTRPDKFDATVKLTAKLKYFDGVKTDSLYKDFTAVVLALHPAGDIVAIWNFANADLSFSDGEIKVADVSGNGFVGSVKNVAKIRTIGTSSTTKFNVLDLGNSNGYFDMGTDIGAGIYALKTYTVGAYFFMDTAYKITTTTWGNCLWSFSNSASQAGGGNGVMFMSLTFQGHGITPTGYDNESGLRVNATPTQGVWKHIAYTQDADSGRIFIDGVKQVTSKMAVTPSSALTLAGRMGTNFNTIGVPAYENNSYLKQTLVYGFELYATPLSEIDIANDVMSVQSTLVQLNAAYAANANDTLVELYNEWANLTMDLSAVTSDITLPVKGTLDTTIVIQWKSTHPELISTTGVVTRPDYFDRSLVLTAVLMKNGQTKTKSFPATVLFNPGTEYTNDLIISYDFDSTRVDGVTVTDASEKHFTGTLKKNAIVSTLGRTVGSQYNVLQLNSDAGTDSAYFDMGTECGKVIFGLKNYTVSVYFLIDTAADLTGDGNFIYTFANSNNSAVDRNGYMFGQATTGVHCLSSGYWATGNEATIGTVAPLKGTFHHFAFIQSDDTLGTAILDGVTISSAKFSNLPSTALVKDGLSGTLYNFLGRSNFKGDRYLPKAMIADFKVYKKALTGQEIADMQQMVINLNTAYADTVIIGKPTSVPVKPVDKIRVNTSEPGLIQIMDLKGNEKVAVYDLMGRKVAVYNTRAIAVKSGIYIVRVDNKVTKVFVK